MNQADANISKRSNVRWMIVVMLTLLALLGHFNRVSISVAGNERFIRDSLIDSQKMGMVYSVFLIVYTVVMLPAGWWIDRLGPKSMLTLMAIGMGVCVVLTGLLGYLSLDAFWFWILLMTIRGVAGMASTPLHPSAARAVSLWIPPSKRAWANGLVTAGALLGIAASYPLFGWLMDRVDWPAAFVICGLVMVAFGIVWQMLAADHATEHPWANSAERALVGSENLPRQLQGKEMLRECGGLLRNRSLLLLTLSYASVGYFQYLFFYWIEYFFEKRLGLPPLESRRASALVMLAMAAGMAFGGRLADAVCQRLGRRWGRRILAIGGMTLSALFAKIGLASDDPSSVTVWFTLALGSLGACEGVFWTAITELGGRTGGLAAAFLNTGGNAGGSVAPWLTAVLVAKYGWDAAINVACGLAVFGGLLWLWLHPNHAGDLRT